MLEKKKTQPQCALAAAPQLQEKEKQKKTDGKNSKVLGAQKKIRKKNKKEEREGPGSYL